MTFRELAKTQGLFVTNNDVIYFEKYEMMSDFIWEANRVGIKTQVHQHPDSGKVTYAVVEVKEDKKQAEIEKELYDQQCKTHYYHEGTWYPKALETRYNEDERRRERVEAALKRFEENFKPEGDAKTIEGEVMAARAQKVWAKGWMQRILRIGRPRIVDRSEK